MNKDDIKRLLDESSIPLGKSSQTPTVITLTPREHYNAHYACTTCGRVYCIPKADPLPWCLHNGSSAYARPNVEEEGEGYKERWSEYGWTECVTGVMSIKVGG